MPLDNRLARKESMRTKTLNGLSKYDYRVSQRSVCDAINLVKVGVSTRLPFDRYYYINDFIELETIHD